MSFKVIYNYKILIVIILFVTNVLYVIYDQQVFYGIIGNSEVEVVTHGNTEDEEYIIDTPGCRIESLDPYGEEIIKYVYKIKKISCRENGLLTYISRSKNFVNLIINNSALNDYSIFTITCCYSTIKRNPVESKPDDRLTFSDCTYFNDTVQIREDFVKVVCYNFFQKVYENIHSTLQPPKEIGFNENTPNVLLIGIDGVSRSNLIRSMPKTFDFCERNEWVNLKGYNKIDDNTFPNLMAVLTGMNYTQAATNCNPYEVGKLDNCEFIWKKYADYNNYSTAYAEDTPAIATFNGAKSGFIQQPTDYYFRPYFLTVNELKPVKYLCLKAHCTGPEKTGIRMQNLITDFLNTIKNLKPGIGLFWMNSFSHEDVNCPSSMDDDFSNFLEEIQRNGHLDNTIVVFFSDHGFRYGKIRLTHTGWMEERLPFIYIWIPEKYRQTYRNEYTNLLENSEKLTTPFDLHMTLQHILSLSNKDFVETPSQGCPECQSLFRTISSNRTCQQAGIPGHYCTCSRYERIEKYSPLTTNIAEFFVNKLNDIIRSYGDDSNGCSTYHLDRITIAKSLIIEEEKEENVLIGIVTNPEAIFEATIKITYENDNSTYTLLDINRLDRYAPKTFCVENSPVKMYCYCRSALKHLINVFCNNKFCFLYVLKFIYIQ